MGTTANCYLNEVGKVLKKLRVDYGENQIQQGKRLGFNPAYLSMVSTDRRGLSFDMYKSIMEHYGSAAENYKPVLKNALVKADVRMRFKETFPDATDEQIVYVMYGEK